MLKISNYILLLKLENALIQSVSNKNQCLKLENILNSNVLFNFYKEKKIKTEEEEKKNHKPDRYH